MISIRAKHDVVERQQEQDRDRLDKWRVRIERRKRSFFLFLSFAIIKE